MSVSLSQAMRMVASFHERCRVSAGECPSTWEKSYTLQGAGQQLVELSKHFDLGDRRELRAHLLVEELGELLIAMGSADPVEALDAMADTLYVLLGTAVTFEMPLEEAFTEVHRSNMTKEKQPDDPHAERVRSKGPKYQPPRLTELYAVHQRCVGKLTREQMAELLGVSQDTAKRIEYEVVAGHAALDAVTRHTSSQSRSTN